MLKRLHVNEEPLRIGRLIREMILVRKTGIKNVYVTVESNEMKEWVLSNFGDEISEYDRNSKSVIRLISVMQGTRRRHPSIFKEEDLDAFFDYIHTKIECGEDWEDDILKKCRARGCRTAEPGDLVCSGVCESCAHLLAEGARRGVYL